VWYLLPGLLYTNAFGATGRVVVNSVPRNNNLHMKIFDWKKREEFHKSDLPDGKVKEFRHRITFIRLVF
jgi:hypothetical protein